MLLTIADITLADVQHLLAWEKKSRKLPDKDASILVKLARGELPLTDYSRTEYVICKARPDDTGTSAIRASFFDLS